MGEPSPGFLTIDDFDVDGKTVFLRVDINSGIDKKTGNVVKTRRIEEHSRTIKELSDRNAKLVILAHQGRAGGKDFTLLEGHAKLLSECTGKNVGYVDDVIGPAAVKRIQELKSGEILLLDNVRLMAEEGLELKPEEHARSHMISRLAPLAEVFINDAFSAIHRSHASLVGFTATVPSGIGRVMEHELESLGRVVHNVTRPCTYILGGNKPKECLKIMRHVLDENVVDDILLGGVIGNIFLLASGYDVGRKYQDFMEREGAMAFIPEAKKLLDNNGGKIHMPQDLALETGAGREEVQVSQLPRDDNPYDIGAKTMEKYIDIIKKSMTIVIKGPMGVYENHDFAQGTEAVFQAIADSEAFSLIGGGDTSTAIKALGMDASRYSYVSLGGGALLSYLGGEHSPVLEALNAAAKR